MTRFFNIPMRVTTKQKMNHEHNYWHAPVSSCTLSTDALVLVTPVMPDMIIPSPSGHRLSASFFQVYRCRSTRTFDLKIWGLNPHVFPFGAECCRIRPLRGSCAVAPQGLWGASLLLSLECCPLRVLSAVALQGLFFWVFGAVAPGIVSYVPMSGTRIFLVCVVYCGLVARVLSCGLFTSATV